MVTRKRKAEGAGDSFMNGADDWDRQSKGVLETPALPQDGGPSSPVICSRGR